MATGRDYVTSTATFSGNGSNASLVTWTASTRTLTIHLGRLNSGTLNNTAQATTTVTYTPDAAIDDPAGNTITTTPFTATGQRF